VLSLAAPAAYWVIGHYHNWLVAVDLVWMQTAASIVYAHLRLEQREWKSIQSLDAIRAGWRACLHSFNLAASLALGLLGLRPRLIFIPYLLQWMETIWGIDHPAVGWKPTRIGIRQLIVSTLWTILFIVFGNLGSLRIIRVVRSSRVRPLGFGGKNGRTQMGPAHRSAGRPKRKCSKRFGERHRRRGTFQESLGQYIYPTALDILGNVQVFV
jgi:hypothetical protein